MADAIDDWGLDANIKGGRQLANFKLNINYLFPKINIFIFYFPVFQIKVHKHFF